LFAETGVLRSEWNQGRVGESRFLDCLQADNFSCRAQRFDDVWHAAIGTDSDGGFGMRSTPAGFDTVADLQIIASELERRGYSAADVELIMNGNWVRVFKEGVGVGVGKTV
jgi:membrane dipeptidase